jgi:hypothetical protein
LRTAKNASKSVPAHSGGVFAFFDFVEKRKHPTPKGSVVDGAAASQQTVTSLRDTRALLLRSKQWTKSRQQHGTTATHQV